MDTQRTSVGSAAKSDEGTFGGEKDAPMPYLHATKRDLIRALIGVYGDSRDAWPAIIEGFVVAVDLGLVDRADMTDARATARTMLYNRESGNHGWPETSA
jgi:hypothetical protein